MMVKLLTEPVSCIMVLLIAPVIGIMDRLYRLVIGPIPCNPRALAFHSLGNAVMLLALTLISYNYPSLTPFVVGLITFDAFLFRFMPIMQRPKK